MKPSLYQVYGIHARKGTCNGLLGSKEAFINMLSLLCGDVESCPGPTCDSNSCNRDIPELTGLLGHRGLVIFHQNVRGLFSNMNLILELLHNFGGIKLLRNAYSTNKY